MGREQEDYRAMSCLGHVSVGLDLRSRHRMKGRGTSRLSGRVEESEREKHFWSWWMAVKQAHQCDRNGLDSHAKLD